MGGPLTVQSPETEGRQLAPSGRREEEGSLSRCLRRSVAMEFRMGGCGHREVSGRHFSLAVSVASLRWVGTRHCVWLGRWLSG